MDGELRFARIGHHLERGASLRSYNRSAIEDRRDVADGVGGTRAVAPDAVHHGVELFDTETDETNETLCRFVVVSAHTAWNPDIDSCPIFVFRRDLRDGRHV